jgi:Predicted glycosylase
MLKVERLGVVLQPEEGHAKFNAGMIRVDDKVHMLYRWSEATKVWTGDKTGLKYLEDFVSYAELTPEGKLIYDADFKGFIKYPDRDGKRIWTQDPRIVPFEGEYIIFYTVWDEVIARVGMSRTRDFKTVEHIGVIPTNVWDKDAFILPERVNGKICYIHRIEPEIQIDYFDTLEDMLDPAFWADYHHRKGASVMIRGEYSWENLKVGGSIPPIKTELGWLFIYHGVANDRVPFCYRAGAALLDSANPGKVIARLPYPLLEPTEPYECAGDVNNVVFPQGAYLHDGYLYMSYGGADKVVALCRFSYSELLSELDNHRV